MKLEENINEGFIFVDIHNLQDSKSCVDGQIISFSIKTHIQSKHEGIKYPCNQCDYRATTQSNFQRHIQSKH